MEHESVRERAYKRTMRIALNSGKIIRSSKGLFSWALNGSLDISHNFYPDIFASVARY
jgi:hypothetical protein